MLLPNKCAGTILPTGRRREGCVRLQPETVENVDVRKGLERLVGLVENGAKDGSALLSLLALEVTACLPRETTRSTFRQA